jgi:allantoinase
MLHHRHKLSAYLGYPLRGIVSTTYLRGRRVFDAGEFIAYPGGQMLKRSAS